MLSLDLFNSRYEKKLHEGALDDPITRTQAHLMEPLNQRAADIRTQIRNGKLSGADLDKLEKEYEDLVQQRQDIIFDRKTKTQEQQIPSRQDPFAYVKPEPKGIGDVQDPQQKMAQLAQKSKKGPLANVGAGLKAFIKGEPEPMDEEQQAINPRALGVANFQRLVKANMGNIPTVSLEFIRPEENFKLDQKGLDLISDYYDGLESDQAKNYFIYRVLPSGDETTKVLKQLGWSPQIQQSLPGIPTQGELPLQEKKKSNNDDLEAGDVKVARELQKLRARYPAVRSDIEAVASAEIDSTERSQQQLAAIRGANEKQDALLKQLVALDKEQGREIDGLDQENNSLEKRLAQVQATNDRLQQAIGQMTGTKKVAAKTKATAPQGSADVAQGGIIDVGAPATPTSNTTTVTPTSNTTSATNNKAMKYTSQQIQGLGQAAPNIRGKDPANDGGQQVKKVSGSDVDIEEHGGGIGPRQHWQDLMQEGQPQELINRYLAIDAENDVDAVRAAIQAISRDPALGANSKSRLLGQIGMIIRRHRLPIGRSYYQFMQQYMEAVELDRNRVVGYPQDPATVKHRLDTAKAILGNPRSDADSRREAAAIVAKLEKKVVAETVTDVKSGMAEIYRRLAPKIERHRDSFLAGQLYDELENYAELHGAEREFKQMMNSARNRAHMEYDTNPGGFHNWFWFLPFADDNMTEGTDDVKKRMSKLEALALAANRAGDDAKCKMYQQKIQSLKQKLSQSMNEFDASGYDRYSIYMDDYDLKEKFSDLDDAVDAIEAYKRDDPKSRYADYNVRDLDGKVVWRNDAWQDIQKPGKIQFLPRNDQGVAEGQVSDEVTHRGNVDTKANIEVLGVDLANDTFKITYNGKPYTIKIQNFSQEDLGRWQIADYDVDIINSKGKKVMIDWDKDRQVTMVNTIIAYLDTQQAGDIQYMAWRQVGLENSTAEDLYQEIQDFYQNDQQKIDKTTAWLAQNMEDTDQRQVFADYVKNPVSRPARTKYIPKEYLMYVAFSYSREGNTELTPGMNLKPIQLTDPDDEEEFYRKVDELFKKVQFKFDAFEKKIIELGDSYGLNSDPDLGSGFGQREIIWDHKTMTTSSSESNLNRQQILAQSILNFQAEVKKYVESFNNTLIKIGLPGISEYSTWSGVLGDQLTDQQVRYFDTPEGFANLATGKVDLAKMLDDNVEKLGLQEQGVAEGLKPGEYHIHTVYFKDGTKKRVRVTSDEFDVADYYTKRGQAVDRVDYDFQLHSDMTEAEKEPTTRQELLDRVDKIQRMMTQERNPANLQILRKKLEMIKQRYQHLKEDSDGSEAVEMAIMRRMLVAHTDLIVEFGLDKVVDAIEEVAYNVGDTDEIGSSDVSGWVRQVKQILGVDA